MLAGKGGKSEKPIRNIWQMSHFCYFGAFGRRGIKGALMECQPQFMYSSEQTRCLLNVFAWSNVFACDVNNAVIFLDFVSSLSLR